MSFATTKKNKGGHGFCKRDLFGDIIGEWRPFDQAIVDPTIA